MTAPIGIIGGSGLYQLGRFADLREKSIDTPFGRPSDVYMMGRLDDRQVVFLPRHGRGHRLLPSEINHRANIYGFKMLGVESILSVTAVGSLREDFRPGDIFLPTQYFDRTKQSSSHTFFGNGIVAHVGFGDPTCRRLRGRLHEAALSAIEESGRDLQFHHGGTYVNMEGPAFSTRSESEAYRAAGHDAIGMTSLPEAKLSREAEICYAAVAMVTDYDCWHASEADVSAMAVLETVRENTALAQAVLMGALRRLTCDDDCACRHALDGAIMTDSSVVPRHVRERLAALLRGRLG